MISMKNRSSRTLLLTALTAAAVGVSSASLAQTTVRLGWTTSDGQTDPYAIAARYFAEELENLAPGSFDVRFYPNHQLGNEEEMLQGMQLGTLEAGVITGTQIASVSSAFQLNDLPFLYADNAQAHAVLDGEVGDMLMASLEREGIIGLGFAEAGFRHVINNTRPVATPEDLSRIRLRVQPSDLFLDSFRALGANPVPMAWSDVFSAVQQGTVDGLEIPLAVIYANQYPEVTEYLSLTNHSYNALGLLVSAQMWNRLDDDGKETMRQAARQAIERQRETVATNNETILDSIREAGMTVNEVDDPAAFRDRVADVYESYRGAIGSDVLDKALEQVQ
ncbi:tripartite ATP-independent transporter DctP family solute receptor [Natronocella acetinitrilica]|uniref:Tripartite ATP-independent transporter DctP family solute receptor n=1 Tax=Natronocella acetinitrilica TaxID=414046 RepID=A0AAE3KGY5_9GAMM|nr:TRAP transporter substrate-binding protein [Natronocella acetinitrilica]MCP1675757.1 tripartite ATP-independent transporter DctP family solute receptor [Natronocella acetinitrilica]